MNVKTLYKRAIEVLVNNNLLITRYKYFNANFGNFSSPHPAMHISVLEGEQFNIYPSYDSSTSSAEWNFVNIVTKYDDT